MMRRIAADLSLFLLAVGLLVALAILALEASAPSRTLEARLIDAASEPSCRPLSSFETELLRRYHERMVARGLTLGPEQAAVTLFVSPVGSWTMVVSTPEGCSRIVAAGAAWESTPLGPEL